MKPAVIVVVALACVIFAVGVHAGQAAHPARIEELFQDQGRALQRLSMLCAPKVLGQMAQQLISEHTESVWFLRSRLIVPGCPLPDGRDIAELSRRGGDAPAVRMLEAVTRCTAPTDDNYRYFELTAEGLRIHFSSCRIDGRELEEPVIDLTFRELEQFKPRREWWGR